MTELQTERATTAEEFLAMTERGRRLELVRGRVVSMSPAGEEHGEVQLELGMRLRSHAKEHGLGRVTVETGFILSRAPDLVRAPDVAFVTAARAQRLASRGFPELAPDLAVEVVSPGDTYSEVREKVDEYLAAGVREVWLVDPRRRRAEVFRPGVAPELVGPEDALRTELLPGLEIRLAELLGS